MEASSLQRMWKQARLTLFPHTSLHLQHEFYLWISLTLLAIASLQSFYRVGFGQKGDYIYIGMVSLWLSRHIWLRWIITRDTSTSLRPTVLGIFAKWMSVLIFAGQYTDYPSIFVGEDFPYPTFPEIVPVYVYTRSWINLRIVVPFRRVINYVQHYFLGITTADDEMVNVSTGKNHRQSTSRRDTLDSSHSSRRGDNSTPLQGWKGALLNLWRSRGPQAQLIVVWGVMILCSLSVFASAGSSAGSVGGSSGFLVNNNINRSDNDVNTAKGNYAPQSVPSWTRVMALMVCGSTLATFFMFARISLPIPDLVAGQNVLKAVRMEAQGSSAKDYATGKIKHKHHHHHKSGDTLPWSEQLRPISYENRFRLATHVTMMRILDAIVCCALLPRTPYVCRATGHCPINPTLWEFSKILSFAGITTPGRSDGGVTTTFSSMQPDVGGLVAILLSILLICIILLMGQLITLNKSYLSTMGYIAGEWKLVEDYEGSSIPPQWDPRRRYNKGDQVTANHSLVGRSVYMATSNSPEGRPFDLYLRATHDLFRNELGHASTSAVVSANARMHSVALTFTMLITIYRAVAGFPISSWLSILLANGIAHYGLVTVGLTDRKELIDIAKEIRIS